MNEEKRLQGTWLIDNFTRKSGARIKSDLLKFGEEQLKFILDNHYISNQQVTIIIKVENCKSKSLEFNAKFKLINKDEAKNLEISQNVVINQSDAQASVEFPVKGNDFVDNWVDDDEVKIKYDITNSDGTAENTDNNNEQNNNEIKIKKSDTWNIANFEECQSPIESPEYAIKGLTFKLLINRPNDYKSNETKFSIDIQSVNVEDKNIKYTFQIEVMNEHPSKSATGSITYQFEKEEDNVNLEFNLAYKEITEPDGFLYLFGLSIKIFYANYDFTLDSKESDNESDTSKENESYDITNYNSYYNSSNYSTYGNYSAVSSDSSKKDTGYVGLRNQGATCYMNSMLQSLFHIPAFRKLVYRMHTTGSEDVTKSIPLCLQRLFVYMQCSDKSCSTKALTKSFGWDDYQTIVQHDVQEFCRVLIDNLEEKMKNTELDGEIAKLFRGKYRNFIRCINVPFESSKEEYFYDIQLIVKDTPDLATSFSKYIEPEILQGENQYQTEEYGKQDVKMGTEFVEFPSVLQIHLRRFEYDFNFDQMVKINSRFEFPPTIDLSKYLAEDADKTKPNIFDLYGVLVHSGSTTSGHYYAFLRTSTGTQWYQFNDSHVTTATAEESIDENFGGSSSTTTAAATSTSTSAYTYGGHTGYSVTTPSYYNYNYNYSYNYNTERSYSAYMLVYVRRSDAERIFTPVGDDEIPEHLRQYFKEHPDDEETTYSTTSTTSSNELDINVVPEEGIIVNSILGKVGFECPELQKSFSFNRENDNDKTLYEKVASGFGLKPEQIRLWTTYYQFCPSSILSCKTTNLTTSTNFFLQKKKEDEDLENDKQIIILMKFYDAALSVPLQYLGTTIVEKSDTVTTLRQRVIQILGFPENLADQLIVFQEYSSNAYTIDKEKSFANEYSKILCLVFQFEQKFEEQEEKERKALLDSSTFHFYTKEDLPKYLNNETTKPKEEDNTKEATSEDNEKQKKEKESEEASDADIYKDLPLFCYSELIGAQKAKDVSQFIQSLKDPILVAVYDYENIYNPIAKLQFPPSLSLDDLRKFVAVALKLDYNPEKDLLLIYKKGYYDNEPYADPIQTETITYEFTSYNKSVPRAYYRLIHNLTKEQMDSMINIEVSISEDSCNVTKKKKILVSKESTMESIRDKIFEMANINPSDFPNPNMYRLSKIDDHKYDTEYNDLSQKLPTYDKSVRLDIIPENQRELIEKHENEDLILVKGSHMTTEYSRAKYIDDPFYFILNKKESYNDLVNRIKETLKIEDFKRSKILISDDDKPTISTSTKFMKADSSVEEYISSFDLTKSIYLFVFHPPHQSSSKNEAVKIIN